MVAAQVASSELASPIENCGVQCFFSVVEAGDQFFGVLGGGVWLVLFSSVNDILCYSFCLLE